MTRNPQRSPVLILGKIDISPLIAAKKTFDDSMSVSPRSTLERDGAIQRFEYTFELAWKTMKRILKEKGASGAQFPKDVIRDAATLGLIGDPVVWFSFLEKRNQTSHIYDDEVAEQIEAILPVFQNQVNDFIEILKNLK